MGDGVLLGLLPGGIHESVAPEGTLFPVLTFAATGSVDNNALTDRMLSIATYQVKAIDKVASIAGLVAIQRRVDALLQGQINVPAQDGSGMMLGCRRTGEILLPDPDLGADYRQLISLYQIFLSEA